MKHNFRFKFKPPAMYVVFVVRKSDLIKCFSFLKIYQNTKFHGSTLTGASFVSTSEI
jgi:hypothetical protein